MIIVHPNQTKVTSFENYQEIFGYIEKQEQLKQGKVHPKLSSGLSPGWVFTCHRYQRALALHQYIAKVLMMQEGQEMDMRGFDVLEIYQGTFTEPSLQPITPNLDIGMLKEEWCRSYLKAHGYFYLKPYDLSPFMKPW